MNTLEITKCLKKLCHLLEFNVYAANRIPIHVTQPFYMISNLDPDTRPGSHWIALYINNKGVGEYFDTFGRKPESYHLSFLRKNTNRWIYNHKVIQSVFSSVCGEYCLLYLYFKLRGMCMTDFIDMFTDDTFQNDIMLKQMFKTFIV